MRGLTVRFAPNCFGLLLPCALTVHSSRRRFAARLNSGVRPLKSWASAATSEFDSSCSVSGRLELQCSDCACGVAAAISLLWFHAATSMRPGVLWLLAVRPCWFRGSGRFVHRRSALPVPAAVPECARVASCCMLRAVSCGCIGCAHAPGHHSFVRFGGLTVRSSRHRFTAAIFFGMLRSLSRPCSGAA